ncbi:hypothetical protein [Mycobacterium sp. pR1184]|uniref:hypothetical protein n=1 Tax=Mycobacterium sp. pR1184 TaxID=3238981 RepID=UPI00351B807D
MEAAAVLYVVAIAAVAQHSGWHYLLFPALAALSADVLTRPWGKWASQPGRVIITPTIGAGIGTMFARQFGYGVVAVCVVTALCLILLFALKSNIAPTIAAGMLPLVLDITSGRYPILVMVGLSALIIVFLPWRWCYRNRYCAVLEDATDGIDDVLETPPVGYRWVVPFALFVVLMALCATAFGLRLLLIPPLVVIAYEMFSNPTSCPWARKPVAFPIACFLTSSVGCLAVSLLGIGGLAAGCSMTAGIMILRLLQIHMPPALAIGILPLIINSPGLKYPVAVTVGTVALTLSFLIYRRWCRHRPLAETMS